MAFISVITVAGDNVVDTVSEATNLTITGTIDSNVDSADYFRYSVDVSIFGGDETPSGSAFIDEYGNFSITIENFQSTPGAAYYVEANLNYSSSTVSTSVQTFLSTVCFYPGTMIATPEGEKAVETLAIGDLVRTADGRAMPVRWLGEQTVSLVFSDKLKTLPIRIKAGALGDNVPARDLLVSPGHAMFIDGTLVVAGALVNGTSIVRETNVPQTFNYYHVELAEHTLILAENAPAESFVDNVDRDNFHNWDEHQRLYAHLPPLVEMDYPVAKSHRQVPTAIRQMLAKRAALISGEAQQVA